LDEKRPTNETYVPETWPTCLNRNSRKSLVYIYTCILQVADYLVEKGAKSNLRNKKGRTAYEMEGMEDPDADVTVNDSSPNQIRGGGRS